jgi:hypothetical protein
MNLDREKLVRFLRDGHGEMFIYEMQHGYELGSIIEDKNALDKAIDRMVEEIAHTCSSPYYMLGMYAQCMDRKKVVWMEGPQGWTTWLEDQNNILT